MAHGSGEGPGKDRRPVVEEWDALNSQAQMPRLDPAQLARSRKREFVVPTHAPEEVPDIAEGQIRSYGWLFALIALAAIGGGLYFLALSTPETDLSAGPAIHFNSPTLQEAGRVGDDIKLPPLPSRRVIQLTSSPPGATIVANGNLVDQKTPASVSVIGQKGGTIELRLADHEGQSINLKSGQNDYTVSMKPARQKTGRLILDSVPSGSVVSLNGVELGKTPQTVPEVAADGTLLVRFTLDGHDAHTVLSSVEPGQERRITVPLSIQNGPRKTASIRIETDPMVARVDDLSLGGKPTFLGSTGYRSLVLTQRIGAQFHLAISAPEHATRSLWLDVLDADYTLQLKLKAGEKRYGTLTLKGPRSIEVYLDSNQQDPLPLKAKKITAGQHVIVVMDPETRSRAKFEISVEADEKAAYVIEYADGQFGLKKGR